MSDATDRDWIAASKTYFVARDRASRFAFRLKEIARDRRMAYAGDRVGMTSFAEAGPALASVEKDLEQTIADVLAGRLRDRERGETTVPLVVALEGVRERVRRAREAETTRLSRRGDPAAAWGKRLLLLLEGACARLDAFAAVYDRKRMVPEASPTDVDRLLARVEEESAPPGAFGPHADVLVPRLVTSAEPLDDLLRAVRAEVPRATRPWRVRRHGGGGALSLSLGGDSREAEAPPPSSRRAARDEPPSLLAPDSAAGGVPATPAADADRAKARTELAAQVLALVQATRVERTSAPDGSTSSITLVLDDAAGKNAQQRVAAESELPPHADEAVRVHLRAAAIDKDPEAAPRLVAMMGLLRSVEKELERVLLPSLQGAAARVEAGKVPRESSRKAPVKKEIVDALASTYPAFPTHRVDDVLEAVAHGKASASHTKPPDAAVALAVLGRRHAGSRPFGDRVLALDPWTEADVDASVRDVSTLALLRRALERGKGAGPGWDKAFEESAFGLLRRLARVRTAGGDAPAPSPTGGAPR